MRKSVVVFMYNFLPIGAGRGIAWNQFCGYLSREYNINLITIEPSINDPIYNESKLYDIDKRFKLHRTSPGRLYNKMYQPDKPNENGTIRKNRNSSLFSNSFVKKVYKTCVRNFIFPDRMIFWNKTAEEKFIEINNKHSVDLIITVGFPFSTHLLGYKLRRKYNVKWIMDYGDPWSFNPSSETVPRYRRWLDKIVESKIIKHSDHITVTTDTTKEAFEAAFKNLPEVSVVKQGVDCKVFSEARVNKENARKKVIDLFYSGIFYKDIRNPENFFIAISQIERLPVDVNIIIAGHMEDYVIDLVDKLSFPSFIRISFVGNISFEKVVSYQANADGLIFFGNKGALQIPGKIYEYLASCTPILSISYQCDAVSDMIKFYQRGETSLNSVADIKKSLETFVSNLVYNRAHYSSKEIEEFDWSNISIKMGGIIKGVLEKGNV